MPPDADLRVLPFMPLDVDRLLRSDTMMTLSDAGFRAALRLWCASWHQLPAASLPNDPRILCHLAGLGRDMRRWRRYRAEAMRGFKLCSDGRWYHPVVVEKALEAWSRRQTFGANMAEARKRRWPRK